MRTYRQAVEELGYTKSVSSNKLEKFETTLQSIDVTSVQSIDGEMMATVKYRFQIKNQGYLYEFEKVCLEKLRKVGHIKTMEANRGWR
jgi:hypothetical protein